MYQNDVLKMFGSLSHHFLITPSFIKFDQTAHSNYYLWIEEKKSKETTKRRQVQEVEDE